MDDSLLMYRLNKLFLSMIFLFCYTVTRPIRILFFQTYVYRYSFVFYEKDNRIQLNKLWVNKHNNDRVYV